MFQFVSKSRTWIWRKLQKIVKIYSERFKTKKNGIFHRKSDISNSNFSEFKKNIAFFDKNDRNTIFWSKADKNMKLGKKCFSHFRFVI